MIIPPFVIKESCPGCGKDEDIKQVCRHCGYEYKNEWSQLSLVEKIVAILGVIIILWLIFTIVTWLFFADDSLFEIIKSQYEHIKELRIY